MLGKNGKRTGCGRPRNVNFDNLNFTFIKLSKDHKYRARALCNVCRKILHNTAAQRLQSHRNNCPDISQTRDNKNNGNESETREIFESKIEIEDPVVSEGFFGKCTERDADADAETVDQMQFIEMKNEEESRKNDSNTFGESSISSQCKLFTIPSSHNSASSILSSKSDTHCSCITRKSRDHLSQEEESEITAILANFFYACYIPFDVVESQVFKDLIMKLRPAYVTKIPSSKTLSTTLLDSVYEKSISEISLADMVHVWLNLRMTNSCEIEMDNNIQALAAYYLHPFYDNTILPHDKILQIHNFLLQNLNAGGCEQWDEYSKKKGIFQTLYEKDFKMPTLFWNLAEIFAPELSKLALQLLQTPATSEDIEKFSSNWSQRCASITTETPEKLMHLNFVRKIKDKSFDFDN